MKKFQYFTDENISDVAQEMLDDLDIDKQDRWRNPQPERSALIILDMQKYFLNEVSHAFVPSAPPVLRKINKLAGSFRKTNQPVILTQHINTTENAGMMSTWWDDLITDDHDLSELATELLTPNSTVIEKSQYDAFYDTSLDQILHEKEIEDLIITGVMTHLCCESTARSAFVRGYSVFFAVDGTATYNEALHRASLLNLSHGFAVPVLMDDIYSQFHEYTNER